MVSTKQYFFVNHKPLFLATNGHEFTRMPFGSLILCIALVFIRAIRGLKQKNGGFILNCDNTYFIRFLCQDKRRQPHTRLSPFVFYVAKRQRLRKEVFHKHEREET